VEELYNKLMVLIVDYESEFKEKIIKACDFAIKYHSGQKRQSGEDYITHPLQVAITLARMKTDADTICAGLLHDTVEDTSLTLEEIAKYFNNEVAKLVSGVTKISNINISSPDEAKSANDRKIILSMTEDIRIVIVKLADRLHNMQTLQYKSPEKRAKIAYETLEVFVPLANYIGAYTLKNELEDLSLKYLQPDIYNEIKAEVIELYTKHEPKLKEMMNEISGLLRENGINCDIRIGIKNIYGTYKKKKTDQEIEHIPELFSFKISVDDLKSCYYALGIIHTKYPPKSGIVEDLIANPKHNTYRSLHSTFLGTNNLLVQNQIRTKDMDFVAAYGLTAYWRLNPVNVRERMQKDLSSQFQFFNSIKEIDATFSDNDVFLGQIRRQLFSNRIRVFSPTKKITYLQENAKVSDLINNIDPQINEILRYVLVNGIVVDTDYLLKDGDQAAVYVNTYFADSSQNPSGYVIFDQVLTLKASE